MDDKNGHFCREKCTAGTDDTPRKAVVGAVEAELGPDVSQLDAREGRVDEK